MLSPEYETDRQEDRMNPLQEKHRVSMPGIRCEVCHTTWAGSRRLYLSNAEAARPLLKKVWALDAPLWHDLATSVKSKLGLPEAFLLKPGDTLSTPTYLLKGRPQPIMFPPLGAPLVEERVAQRLTEANLTGLSLLPVSLVASGKGLLGEPPTAYFILRVTANQKGTTEANKAVCDNCGYPGKSTSMPFPPELVAETDFFTLDENPYNIYVRQNVVDLFSLLELTNVRFL